MGKKPDVSNLKVFGCNAYMHIANESREKWNPKSKKCIFIGYSIYSKAYRLWDPEARKICVSRHVLFDENNMSGRIGTPQDNKIESSELTSDNGEQKSPEEPVKENEQGAN